MAPPWLHVLAASSLLLGAACAVVVAVDVIRRPRRMAVTSVVWPVTALSGTLAVVWSCFGHGRLVTMEAHRRS